MKGFLGGCMCLLAVGACSFSDKTIPVESEIIGLGSPVLLQPDSTHILLADYFLQPENIDSLSAPDGLNYDWSLDKQRLLLIGNPGHKLSNIRFWIDGFRYDILLKQSSKKQVSLNFIPDKPVRSVYVKGEMNSWNPVSLPLKKEGNTWSLTLQLEPGIYQYLFLADGKEILDPNNPETTPNGMGGFNSVLRVGDASGPGARLSTAEAWGSEVSLLPENADYILAYWQNQQLDVQMEGSRAIIHIPDQAREMGRSYIRAVAASKDDISNDVLIPLESGRTVQSASQLGRSDFYKWNMYFVLIDRFKDGNPANTKKVDDPEIHPKANYYGGDFAGITQAIESGYFQKMGINALWLSPITQNPEGAYGYWDKGGPKTKFSGYHGYWPVSSSKLDYRFGTEEEFRELLDVAHANDIAVIVDYVANHVHELHPVYQQNKDWATSLYLPDGTLNTEKWDEHRLTTWFDVFMPTLDFSRPEVVEAMTDSALFWLKNYDLDGFRHDATKHIQLEFWRTLTRKIKTEILAGQQKNIYQVGETYGSRELIASYINSGMLDSQFDFAIYDAALSAFAGGQSLKGLREQIELSLKYYGNHNLMGYISGNHDKARFIAYASGAVSFDEDTKVAGWTREIGIPDTTGYRKLSMLMALNMSLPGIPVTYYGDEFGMPGANDPDNRRWMRFEDSELNEAELKNRSISARLMNLRNQTMAMLYGDTVFHLADETTMAFSRKYFTSISISVFNNGPTAKDISFEARPNYTYSDLEAQFGNSFTVNGSTITVSLPPYSFEILTL